MTLCSQHYEHFRAAYKEIGPKRATLQKKAQYLERNLWKMHRVNLTVVQVSRKFFHGNGPQRKPF